MEHRDVSRRRLLKGGGAALAGLSLQVASPAHAFQRDDDREQHSWDDDKPDPSQSLGQPGDVVIPWLDQPPPFPAPEFGGSQLVWEELDSWLIPPEKFHFVTHYGIPTGLDDPAAWRVAIAGLVRHRLSLSLADLKDRPRREIDFTLECSGNHGTGLPFATGFIGNARWAGTPLAPVLEEAGLLEGAVEIVFYGIDRGTQVIRDNSGIVSGGLTGVVEPDAGGGLDLTIAEQFARSMSLDDALDPRNLLCYEMNGEPLPKERFPDPPDCSRLVWRGQRQMADPHRGTQSASCGKLHGARLRDHPRGAAQRPAALDIQYREARSPEVSPSKSRTSRQPLRRPWRRLGWANRGSASPHRQRTVAAGEALRARGPQPEQARLGVEVLDVGLGNARQRPAHGDVQGIRRRRQRAAGAGQSVPCQQSDLLGEQRTHHTPGSHSLIATTVAMADPKQVVR